MKYRILHFLARCMGTLSPKALRRLAGVMAVLFRLVQPKRFSMAVAAMEKHLKLSPEEAAALAKRSVEENFLSFLEIFHVGQFFLETNVSLKFTPESVAALMKETAPIVVATAHLGSWELMPGLATDTVPDRDRMVIVRSQRDRALNRLMQELRGARGMQAIDHRKASELVLPRLRNKGVAAFLVDHNCSRKEAVFLPFMEDTAAVNAGPAMLALRAKAAVYPVFLIRDGKGKHILYILDPLRTEELTGPVSERVQAIARFYTDAVAEIVKKHPEQWFWIHNRWKTRQKDESGSGGL